MLEASAAVASAVVAAFALLFTWKGIRTSALRTEDVYRWANEAIISLNSLYLLLYLSRHKLLKATDIDTKTDDILFTTSNLVEQGRLLFKNAYHKTHGAEKQPAYRGLRPAVLDPLVLAHQIACHWREADEDRRAAMEAVVDDCVKTFVSLAQHEVGRKGTVSKDTQKGGNGADLFHRLADVTPEQIRTLRR
ncbi:hypothetical protein MWN33_18680 [Starkeya koreensis]|uniref:DUF4760 domain-containing protein n=1 Tax=Ancylobacter koreensis TaxID=266121 RepID=A0ABT0DSE4_9HYPH|nr:hypothetical protein [Ancylobacter koreensis]MCK0210062.1 hypothetical protein [Ancylobacter koreensis]